MNRHRFERLDTGGQTASTKKIPHDQTSSYKKITSVTSASKLTPGLYVTATPIGHLNDMTLRGIEVLNSVDIIVCEDTRHSRKLLSHYGIKTKLISYHDHNAIQIRPKLLRYLKAGKTLALISDAGTPVISDPGYKLINASHKVGISIFTVPGPSAITAALAVAGLPTKQFLFSGFLPTKKTARTNMLKSLVNIQASLIFFEASNRLSSLFPDLVEILGSRDAAICRELTKIHEEVVRGKLDELSTNPLLQKVKGEIVIIVGPPKKNAKISRASAEEMLRAALKTLKPGHAASKISAATGFSRQDLYQRAIEISRGMKNKEN